LPWRTRAIALRGAAERDRAGGYPTTGRGESAGGPVGALVGGGIGATMGALAPESGVTMGKKAVNMVLPGEFKGPAVAEEQPSPPVSAGTSVAPAPQGYISPRMTPDLIKSAQRRLHHDGFYNGPIDGIAGRETEKGLLQFQWQQGLPQTGRLDGPTLSKMNLPR
jgi:hypothetical protein